MNDISKMKKKRKIQGYKPIMMMIIIAKIQFGMINVCVCGKGGCGLSHLSY